MNRATMPGKHHYIEYTPEQLQLICDKLSALEDKAEAKLKDAEDIMQITNLWNEICKSYSKVTTLSPARKKAINARLIDGCTVEMFKKAFNICENSEFLKGNNDRNWHATFDWILNVNNLTKVIEGNYGGLEEKKNSHSYDLDKFEALAINK